MVENLHCTVCIICLGGMDATELHTYPPVNHSEDKNILIPPFRLSANLKLSEACCARIHNTFNAVLNKAQWEPEAETAWFTGMNCIYKDL